MARSPITPIVPKGPYAGTVVANSLDFTFTASSGQSGANGNQFVASGKDILLVQNSDVSNAFTFTLTSSADACNRTGDIATYSVGASEFVVYRLDRTDGWIQSDGNVYLEGSNAAIKFAVIALT